MKHDWNSTTSFEFEELLLAIPPLVLPWTVLSLLGIGGPSIAGKHVAIQALMVVTALIVALAWINVSMTIGERLAALRRGVAVSEYKMRRQKVEVEERQARSRRRVNGAIRTIEKETNTPYYDGGVYEEGGVTHIEIGERDAVEVIER